MSDETTRDHWDREQWAKDNTETDVAKDQSTRVWNRQQVEPDDYPSDTPSEHAETEAVDDDAGPLSGRGAPSGEQHWDRVDEG